MFGRIEKPTNNISSHCTRAQTYKYQKSQRMPPPTECGEPGKKAAWRQKWWGGWRRGRLDATGSPETETDDIGEGGYRNEREREIERRRGSLRYTRPFSWRPVRMSVWRQAPSLPSFVPRPLRVSPSPLTPRGRQLFVRVFPFRFPLLAAFIRTGLRITPLNAPCTRVFYEA